jgi:hypothetical protein
MGKSVERRVSYRIPFVSKVICHMSETDKKHHGILRDISITSLFMETDECFQLGDKCDIDIVFEGKFSRLVIESVSGTVVRCNDDGVAIQFDELLEWFTLIPLYFQKMHDQVPKD